MPADSIRRTCDTCGAAWPSEQNSCTCGGQRGTIRVDLSDTVHVHEGLDVIHSSGAGEVLAESSYREDEFTKSSTSVEYPTASEARLSIRAQRSSRVSTKVEETSHAELLARELERRDGKPRKIEEEVDQAHIADAWLVCEMERTAVQVTHLDGPAVAGVNMTSHYQSNHDHTILIANITAAIESKVRAYPTDLRATTILLLISVYPIPQAMRDRIVDAFRPVAQTSGYREIWIAPLQSEPYRLGP
jgi:hypothetical protein